ncbi:histone-lysine N-methyltransferase SETMAR [Trichonephila clavipes]|nr:histone-lysine N-methyltransferase SETMAR [Trichonephila clavipes]
MQYKGEMIENMDFCEVKKEMKSTLSVFPSWLAKTLLYVSVLNERGFECLVGIWQSMLPPHIIKGENASQVAEIANGIYGADTVTANYAQFWYRRFRSDIFDVKDATRTGRSVVENVNKTTEIIKIDRNVSSRSIAQELKIDHKTVLNHLRKVGFKKKLDVWVQHQLTLKNMMDRISICEALAKRNEIDPFLKREAAQTVAKLGLTARKVLLCIWCDWKGITYYELPPYDQTLNSDTYYQQLDHLKLAVYQKRQELANRRGVVFHQDNARPHTSVVTRQKLWEHGWLEKRKEKKTKEIDRKRRGLVFFRGSRGLDRDADDESWMRIRENALRTVPRQGVERATSKRSYHTG